MLRIGSKDIDGIDDLRDFVHGTQVDLVQLDAGRLRGKIRHISTEGFGLSLGNFSHGVRGRGILGPHHVIIGMALASHGPHSQWSYQLHPDDLVVCPAGRDHEASYRGATAICALALSAEALASHFANEGPLRDQGFWHHIRRMHVDPQRAEYMRQSLSRLVSTLMAPSRKPFDPDYVRRTAAEIFGVGLIHAETVNDREPALSGAKAVRRAEDFLESIGPKPVHISELSSSLQVSRRSLHRAFAETLGIGPIEYLRRRRLSSVYSVLRRSEPNATTVMDVAAEHGFLEFGRFAAYYRRLFDEYPMETLRRKP